MDDSRQEVAKYARLTLQRAGVGDRLPTPIDDIVSASKLVVAQDVSLAHIHQGFLSKAAGALRSALSKLRALIDFREKQIYVDTSMSHHQVNWGKLHECGHQVLPWQRNAYGYKDDDHTLSADVNAHFEREANLFAAEVLFQLERFTNNAADLPLNVKSPVQLSKRFGSSCHAAIRRFVETNPRPCAVLVCRPAKQLIDNPYPLELVHAVYSPAFINKFGHLLLPRRFEAEHIFAKHTVEFGTKLLEDGEVELRNGDGEPMRLHFSLFNSTYNVFIFVHPLRGGRLWNLFSPKN